MKLRVRPFSEEDIPQITSIELQSYTCPWSENQFRSELINLGYNHSLVAIDEESRKILGYCFFWILLADEIHIHNISVHPDHRRKGIAKRLLDECFSLARRHQCHSAVLEVRESNQAARALYNQLGFEELGRRFKYYAEPVEDALILRCWLNPGHNGGKV